MKCKEEHDEEEMRRSPMCRSVTTGDCGDEPEFDYGHASVATRHEKVKVEGPEREEPLENPPWHYYSEPRRVVIQCRGVMKPVQV